MKKSLYLLLFLILGIILAGLLLFCFYTSPATEDACKNDENPSECYVAEALAQEDPRICNRAGAAYDDMCMQRYYQAHTNADVCRTIPKRGIREHCEKHFAGLLDSSEEEPEHENSSADEEITTTDDIVVTSPTRNAIVASPLTIAGKAKGTWFFEASFPIVLLDADGNVLVESHATALDDWMTEDFVPFKAALLFATPAAGTTGTLVLKKDNPSGLPEHDASIEIPVKF